MTIHLITGHAGTPHVTSGDQGQLNSVILGTGAYIIDGCACTMTNANTANIANGSMMLNGRYVRITGNGENVAVESGSVGVTRQDYICARYESDAAGVERVTIVCKKGAAGGAAPSYTSGNILEGATVAEFPLYSIALNGIAVGAPVRLIDTFSGFPVENIPTIPSGKVSGLGSFATRSSLAASDIPSLDASKIATGALDSARVPNLDASKITSGTLSADRVPSISASKITSGALAVAQGGTGATTGAAALQNLGLGKGGAPWTKLFDNFMRKGGSVNIPNINKYRLFAVYLCGTDGNSSTTPDKVALIGSVALMDNPTHIDCTCSFDDGTSTIMGTVSLTVSGTTVTMRAASTHTFGGTQAWEKAVRQIWGVI